MKRLGSAAGFSAFAALAIAACTTDNGPNVYGPTFGPFPEREGGTSDVDGGGPDPEDGGGDGGSDTDGAAPCATGLTAVLGGGATGFSGSIQDRDAAWTTTPLGTTTLRSRPAVVAFGTGFLGVARDGTDALVSVRYTTSFGQPTTIGMSDVKGAPSLAVSGAQAHVVYAAGAGPFFWSGVHDGTSWDAASTRVSADGMQSGQSFGTTGAGLAADGAEIVFAENGADEKLYVRTLGTGWSASKQVANVETQGAALETTPELVAHDGAFDLAVIYVRKTTRQLAYATRAAASNPNGDWVDGGILHPLATTAERFSAARISATTILVTFRGQDGNGYL